MRSGSGACPSVQLRGGTSHPCEGRVGREVQGAGGGQGVASTYGTRFGQVRHSPRHWPEPPVFGQPSAAADCVTCPEQLGSGVKGLSRAAEE
jgi:hypothetical protein